MAVGDVNRDNHLDLIVSASIPSKSNPGAVGFTFLLGDGTGSFHPPVMVTAKNGAAGGVIAVGDLNRDGDLDVLSAVRQAYRKSFSGMEMEPSASRCHLMMARVKVARVSCCLPIFMAPASST